jgi:hypothetical protein
MAAGWSVMWGVDTYFNPVAFWSLWTGASLLMWTLGRPGYPGIRRHLQLAVVSIPVWWWFELMTGRVQNWQYAFSFEYGALEYAILTSVAFSTVVPAINAANSMIRRAHPQKVLRQSGAPGNHRMGGSIIALGVALQIAVVALPAQLFPLVWVAPALVFDGIVAWMGGRSLVRDLISRRWADLATIAAAGLVCGLLWEFWNFWSMPKWEYEIPFLGFWEIFEMPVTGYLGYVPFAWAVTQLVRWLDQLSIRPGRGSVQPIWNPG